MRVAAALLLLAGAPVLAQSGRTWVTELGRRVLTKSDQVVEARVVKVLPAFRGITTARLAVKERLSGYDRSLSLVLLFIEDYTAPDAFTATLDKATVRYERRRKAGLSKYLGDLARFKVPRAEEEMTRARAVNRRREEAAGTRPKRGVGVRFAVGEEGVFFLERKGASYALVGYLPTRDPLYAFKRDRLSDILRLEAIPGFDLRARNAKLYFFTGVKSANPWERGNSARELGALATRYPKLFTKEEARRLAGILFKEKEPPIRASLERAVRAVDPEAALAYAQRAEAEALERNADALSKEAERIGSTRMPELRAAELVRVARAYGRAATTLLTRYLEDAEPVVRERVAQALAEQGGPSAREPLRRALARETDPEAAMALIYACGVKADPEAVPLLAKRLNDRRLARAAIHALARVGTPPAREVLQRQRRVADATTQDLIDTLLREEFAEQP